MSVINFVKRQDLFGVPVQLTYRGERAFTSFIGGFCSIMFVLSVISTFVVYSRRFFDNPQFSSNASVNFITYGDDQEVYSFPTERTTIAV